MLPYEQKNINCKIYHPSTIFIEREKFIKCVFVYWYFINFCCISSECSSFCFYFCSPPIPDPLLILSVSIMWLIDTKSKFITKSQNVFSAFHLCCWAINFGSCTFATLFPHMVNIYSIKLVVGWKFLSSPFQHYFSKGSE